MKKLRWMVVLVVVLFSLSACATSVIHSVKERGELVVGTAGDMPPLNMKTKDGRLIGYEIDLAQKFANYMEVKLRVETMPFSQLLPALEAGKVDMVISGMTITPDRNLRVAFVGPYLVTGKSILTKEATLARVDDISKIKASNVKLAALKGSTSQAFVQGVFPNVQLVTTESYDEAVKLVLEDKVHAMVADHPICITSVFRYPDKGLVALITPFTYEPLGIAVPPDDPLLVNWLENLMKSLEGMGELKKLNDRWFRSGSWVRELP
jgi:polar amino acid transport system substrate-binding protein